jgi:hypothetical protein
MNRIILATAALIIAQPAFAGGICIDCVTKHPSHKTPSVNDMMKAINDGQWEQWNANAREREAQADAHREAERAARVQESQIRANNAAADANAAEANRANAAAGYLNRASTRGRY